MKEMPLLKRRRHQLEKSFTATSNRCLCHPHSMWDLFDSESFQTNVVASDSKAAFRRFPRLSLRGCGTIRKKGEISLKLPESRRRYVATLNARRRSDTLDPFFDGPAHLSWRTPVLLSVMRSRARSSTGTQLPRKRSKYRVSSEK